MFGKFFGTAKPLAAPVEPDKSANFGSQLQREFAQVENHLRGMPGHSAILDVIALITKENWPPTWIEHGNLKRRISDPDIRGHIFDCVDVLASKQIWNRANVENSDRATTQQFSPLVVFCMNLSGDVLEGSFPIDQDRAAKALQFMAANLPNMRLKAWAYNIQIFKLGIIRDIRNAMSSGLEIAPEAKIAAGQLLKLLTEMPENKGTVPEIKDNAVIKALRELAGQDRQQTFFQRMLAAGNKRERQNYASVFTPEARALWCETVATAQTLLNDFADYRNGKKAADWIINPDAFEAALGKHVKDPGKQTVFGWWIEEPPRPKSFLLSHSLLGLAGTAGFPKFPYMTAERLDQICRIAEAEETKQRFSASAPNIMDIGLFQFEGKDIEGSLFNLFSDASGSAPNPKWKASARIAVEKIGTEAVAKSLNRWIEHFKRLDAPPSDHNALETVGWSYGATCKSLEQPGHIPAVGTPAFHQAAFRGAWNQLANDGQILFDKGDFYQEREGCGPYQYNPDLSGNNETVACGVAHTLALLPANLAVPLLAHLFDNLLLRNEHRECRNKKVVSACCTALGEIGTPDALALLGKVRRHLKDKTIHKQIDKALANVGTKESLSLDDMKDRAMASHGVDRNGRRVIEIADWRAELWVESTRKTKLQTTSPTGKVTRGIAKAFTELQGGAEAAKSLTDSAKDIESILPEARKRLEGSYRNQRSWPLAFWQQHLVGNGLLHTIVSRLVWHLTDGRGKTLVAMLRNGAFMDHAGKEITLQGDDWTVRLWHPVNDSAENVDAWRKFIIRESIRQPFLQAWRPVYIVTEAERRTSTYSNRFAAHVLEQAPAMAVLKAKGWNAVNRVAGGNKQGNERVRIALPAYHLAAEYWVAGVGNRMQAIPGQDNEQSTMYAFVGTDRLAFFKLEEKNNVGGEVITIENVPTLALSEVMLDIDNIVARTSIGNDRNWKDEGTNAQHPASETVFLNNYVGTYRAGQSAELAATRHAFLAEILPGLEIANCCTLQTDHLMVDGKYHSYKINLTSGGIHIAPNDQYLCIVPTAGSTKETLLPFEDDAVLSIIISKAMMLADEDQITDESIRRQIGLK